jgi:hypothetical protein
MFDMTLCVNEDCILRDDCKRAFLYDMLLLNPKDDGHLLSISPFDNTDKGICFTKLSTKDKEDIDTYFKK